MLRKVFIVLCLVLPAVFVVPAVAQAQLPDFTELVEKQGPAVVNISTTQGGARNPLAQQMISYPGPGQPHGHFDYAELNWT